MQMMCQISLDYLGVCARLLCAALLCNPHNVAPEPDLFICQGIARLPVFFAFIQHMGIVRLLVSSRYAWVSPWYRTSLRG